MEDRVLLDAIEMEKERQIHNIELIASENFASKAVRDMQSTILTNKYAEGYPGKRYYGGCKNVDIVEELAIQRACELFGAEHANVQPHSGSQANMAVYFAMLQNGETVLGMDLAAGGHLTHGAKVSFSGKTYNFVSYGVDKDTECLDYDAILALAKSCKPKMIVCGASAYPRTIDFEQFKKIADEVGAYLMVDMAHIAGLVAGGMHENPVPYADFVTTTTHKTLRGPRGGMILCKKEYAKKIDSAIFPGIQGGPLCHVVASKAQCLFEASQESFKDYAKQVVRNCEVLANTLQEEGFRIVSGKSENHLLLVDTKHSIGITGKQAEEALEKVHITANKNAIPFDEESPFVTSGIRLGTAAMTSRGFKEEEFKQVGLWISKVLHHIDDEALLEEIGNEVYAFTARYPLP